MLKNSVPQKEWLKANTNTCGHLKLKTNAYRIVGLLCGWMVVRFIGLYLTFNWFIHYWYIQSINVVYRLRKHLFPPGLHYNRHSTATKCQLIYTIRMYHFVLLLNQLKSIDYILYYIVVVGVKWIIFLYKNNLIILIYYI